MSHQTLVRAGELRGRVRHRAPSRRSAPTQPADRILELQRMVGNASVARFLQRQPTPAPAPAETAAPLEPETVSTDYGEFHVYPDEFVGPLPVADPTIGPWSVRARDFGFIDVAIESVRGGAAGIKVEGTKRFKSGVLMDVAWLLTQSVGHELLGSIVGSGKDLTIKESASGNTTSYAPDADSYERADGSPGPGCSVTVGYNLGEWNPYGGAEPWMRRPPAIGLAHELVHAWTGMTGTRALGETAGGGRRRELQASGLGEFSGAALSENRFRAAFGLPLRPRY